MVGDIHTWINEHYTFGYDKTQHSGYVRCKRCDQDIWHLTKHAVNVHGDTIQVLPGTPDHLAQGLLSDDAGRLVLADPTSVSQQNAAKRARASL